MFSYFNYCSNPQSTEQEARDELEKIEQDIIAKSDGRFKYSLTGVRIWNSAEPHTTLRIDEPPLIEQTAVATYAAYEVCGFSGYMGEKA